MAEVEKKKQGKKTELNINVVIGGFLVLGGALAAAAVVTFLKNRSKRKPKKGSTKKKEDVQGLRSLLPAQSLSEEKDQRKKEALRICSTHVGSSGPLTIEKLIPEKEFGLKSSREEQTPSFEDHGAVLDNLEKSPREADDYDSNKNVIPIDVEGFSFEGVNLGEVENGSTKVVDDKEVPIYLPLVETEVVIEKSAEIQEETRIAHVEERVVKEDISVQEEEEDEDDDNDDDEEEEEEEEEEDDDDDNDDEKEEEEEEEEEEELANEKEGEGSDGTGDSSMDSNAEAIWPAESLETREMKTTHVEIFQEDTNGHEVVKGTNQEHEENGRFENARQTKAIMGKEKGMGIPIMEMKISARSSLISRLLLLWMIMGLAILFLRYVFSSDLYEFSNIFRKFI